MANPWQHSLAPDMDDEEEEGEDDDGGGGMEDIDKVRMKMMLSGRKGKDEEGEADSWNRDGFQPSFLNRLQFLGASCSLFSPLSSCALSPCFLRSRFSLLHQQRLSPIRVPLQVIGLY